MSVRARVWVLKAAFCGLLLALIVTAVPAAQRAADVSPAVRLAIAEATQPNAEAIGSLKVDVAIVKKTAEDAREELVELRRAIWAMAGTLLLSLLTQIRQTKRTKDAA